MDTSKAIHRPMPPHNDSKPLGKNDASVQKSADSSDLLRRDRSNYVSHICGEVVTFKERLELCGDRHARLDGYHPTARGKSHA